MRRVRIAERAGDVSRGKQREAERVQQSGWEVSTEECEQRLHAKRMRLLDTGLSARLVKRKQDYVKIITHMGKQKKYLHVFQKFSRVH